MMLYRTIVVLLCTLVFLREADCRLRRRHHYRGGDHHHRFEDSLSLDENHQRLFEEHHQIFEDRHQPDSNHQRFSEDHHQLDPNHQRVSEVDHRLDSDHRLLGEDHHRPDLNHQRLGEDHHQPDSNHQRLGDGDHHKTKSEAQQRLDELLALEHSERVTEFSTCSVPRPQVVHVSDHHPGRYFLPHCTVLHRCGRHSGCCGTDQLRCVAVAREKVVLPFYSVRMEDIRPGGRAVRRVEKLEFTNHTKCGCAPDHEDHEAVSRNDL